MITYFERNYLLSLAQAVFITFVASIFAEPLLLVIKSKSLEGLGWFLYGLVWNIQRVPFYILYLVVFILLAHPIIKYLSGLRLISLIILGLIDFAVIVQLTNANMYLLFIEAVKTDIKDISGLISRNPDLWWLPIMSVLFSYLYYRLCVRYITEVN